MPLHMPLFDVRLHRTTAPEVCELLIQWTFDGEHREQINIDINMLIESPTCRMRGSHLHVYVHPCAKLQK